MATPLPTDGDLDRSMPHGQEAVLIVRGLGVRAAPDKRAHGLQAALLRAIVHATLGIPVDVPALEPVEPDVFAGTLARRGRMLRTRLVPHMELLNMVLQPPRPDGGPTGRDLRRRAVLLARIKELTEG